MGFQQEQKLMKELKKMKAQYKDVKAFSEGWEQAKTKRKEINDLKRQKLNQPIYETHGDLIKDPVTHTWIKKDTWESSYD